MQLASFIDHSALKANILMEDIEQLCKEAIEYGFAAVCVPPYFITSCTKHLLDNEVKISTVIGFPLGFESTTSKVEEIKRALDMGADELDVVINVGAVKNGDWTFVRNDIETVTRISHMRGKVIKLIIEFGILDDLEVEKICEICADVDVDYVKTSTGFNAGATVEIVKKLRSLLPEKIKIKASGGIKNYDDAKALVEAGADRIGTSSSLNILGVLSKA